MTCQNILLIIEGGVARLPLNHPDKGSRFTVQVLLRSEALPPKPYWASSLPRRTLATRVRVHG
jgi:hypothetical protein